LNDPRKESPPRSPGQAPTVDRRAGQSARLEVGGASNNPAMLRRQQRMT